MLLFGRGPGRCKDGGFSLGKEDVIGIFSKIPKDEACAGIVDVEKEIAEMVVRQGFITCPISDGDRSCGRIEFDAQLSPFFFFSGQSIEAFIIGTRLKIGNFQACNLCRGKVKIGAHGTTIISI